MPWLPRNCTPYAGLMARSTSGLLTTSTAPGMAMAMNQTMVIGPKNAATFAVPRDCTANSATRITTVSGTTYRSNAGVATLRPSTAESTESVHRIAVEQRRADDAAQHDRAAATAERALRQRHQGERAALALVVGPQQDQHVFERDGDDQRPEDQREHAEHRFTRRRAVVADGGGDRLTERVERAGTDVAVDDPDAADGESPERALGTALAVAVDRDRALMGRGDGMGHLSVALGMLHCTIWGGLITLQPPQLPSQARSICAPAMRWPQCLNRFSRIFRRLS